MIEHLKNRDLEQTFRNYWDHALEPGGFATAVLANDLLGAALRADAWNRPELATIAEWVYHSAPSGSWGSYQTVDNWLSRNKHFEQWQKTRVIDLLSRP
jgi:hypothetical protein